MIICGHGLERAEGLRLTDAGAPDRIATWACGVRWVASESSLVLVLT
jgi:hypothetical protein